VAQVAAAAMGGIPFDDSVHASAGCDISNVLYRSPPAGKQRANLFFRLPE